VRKLINNKEKHVTEEMSSKELKNWIKTAVSTNVGRFPYSSIRKKQMGNIAQDTEVATERFDVSNVY
jgi:hypothetical protein